MLDPKTDLPDLYATLSPKLQRVVRVGIAGPEDVIEDACQFAWSRLLLHARDVEREAAFAWLVRTATREARRQMQHDLREVPLAHEPVEQPVGRAADPHELLEAREQLALITGLPRRQQRLLWLHGAGLNYAEMAVHERCTRRTVERQLLRARRSIRAVATQ